MSGTLQGAADSISGVNGSLATTAQGALDRIAAEVATSQRNLSDNLQSLLPKQSLLPPEAQAQLDAVRYGPLPPAPGRACRPPSRLDNASKPISSFVA